MVRGSSSNNNSSVPPPWRQPAPAKKKDKYEHLKMRATKEPGRGSTMYAPPVQKRGLPDLSEPASENMFDFDEDLQLAFQRNFQVHLSLSPFLKATTQFWTFVYVIAIPDLFTFTTGSVPDF